MMGKLLKILETTSLINDIWFVTLERFAVVNF
jgi:hypothetical protein